jgi:hypothetical protein
MWNSKKSEGKALPENKECTEAKGAVQVAVEFIREQCMSIHCPWCKSVYAMGPDFADCFAMNCTNPTCSCDFCGYCGEGFAKNTQFSFGIDACHRHVMDLPPCSPFNTGLYPEDKGQAIKHLAFARITSFLKSLKESDKVSAIFCVAQDLTSLGLSAHLFLGEQYVWIVDPDVELL